jgi:membrane AbrB-like protein
VSGRNRFASLTVTFALAASGAALLLAFDVPAGGLIGAVLFVGTFNLMTGRGAPLPRPIRNGASTAMGAVIGSMITRSVLGDLGAGVVLALLFTAFILTVGVGAGLLLSRWAGIDRKTAILAACPGGMVEMAVIAEHVGADQAAVLGIHLVRRLASLVVLTALLVSSSAFM